MGKGEILMGMFDTVKCSMLLPIPDNDTSDIDPNSLEYQTKDLYSVMEHYVITKEGQLKLDPDIDIGQSLSMSIYAIHEGYWLEYEFLIDRGKVVRTELKKYKEIAKLKENGRWKLI